MGRRKVMELVTLVGGKDESVCHVQQQWTTTSTARDDGSIRFECSQLIRHLNVVPQLFDGCCVTSLPSQPQDHLQHTIVTVSLEFHQAFAGLMVMGLGICGGH